MCSQTWLTTWLETAVSTPFARSPGSRSFQIEAEDEQHSVGSECEALPIHDAADPGQAILPALRLRAGVEGSHEQLNAGGGEVDARPVQEPTPLLCWSQPLAPINDALEDFGRWLRSACVPEKCPPNQRCEPQGEKSNDQAALPRLPPWSAPRCRGKALAGSRCLDWFVQIMQVSPRKPGVSQQQQVAAKALPYRFSLIRPRPCRL